MSLQLAGVQSEQPNFIAMDSERVFYESAELKGADVSTWHYLEDGFSKDDFKVFFASKALQTGSVSNIIIPPIVFVFTT